ncbi:PREDICTED: uncharacterized protein LOC104600080 [Nelumbo nucifera]|uniref:Uncharacterized protein LOC104600080 n=2 Tax=Nelumbo nucifera TaxID=4432 RepID=A0A1U8AFP5_NELNU|nr:PREDICTED: uncharacterized protein LOC104600080 [Nelumbo nucifera]XP_010261206.1 PREDICTED: uncharacterized protein LOC104600080 [Nelumbo nucifera]DAD40259.1 TPA_asm: hypothetical protein HUJ06_014582 [Nelumbo nucifera]
MPQKMPQRNSSSSRNAAAPRRSPRFFHTKDPPDNTKLHKLKSKKDQVFRTPISVEKPQSDSHPSSIGNVTSKSSGGSEIAAPSLRGSKKLKGSVDGVEGSRCLRRSPRFTSSVNIHADVKKRGGDDNSHPLVQSVLTDFPGKEVTLDVKQKVNFDKVETESSGPMGFTKVVGKSEVGIDCSKLSAKKGKGVSSSVTFAVKTPEGGREKKTVDTNRVNKEIGVNKKERFEGFPRRSARFSSVNVLEDANKKGSYKKAGLVQSVFTDPPAKEVTLEVNQKQNTQKEETKFRRSIVGKPEVGIDSSVVFTWKEGKRRNGSSVTSPAMTSLEDGGKNIRDANRVTEESRADRKRKHQESCGLQGWTKDQEVALQKAYFAAKPSPHFWKKVSKLVPGKTAQECFDKVHSDLVTPPQPPPRSRTSRNSSSPMGHFSLSGSKLLEPTELSVKRRRNSKQKRYHAQKTVRHLLQKHYLMDQGCEADLFSVLETTMGSSCQALERDVVSTPECIQKSSGFLQKCRSRSSSAHKKSLPRLRSSCETALVSPPVLKQVKNLFLHEKYIDQLHCREVRRMAASTSAAKCIGPESDRKDCHVQKVDMLKAARNALSSDARDVIKQFQHLQAHDLSNYDDFDEDENGEDNEDDD